MIAVVVILFLFGLAVGSFLNVVIYRAVHDQSFLIGRSKCPHCNKTIAWHDNIPVVSFVLLRRRCRSCHKPISWRYPAIELITAALFEWWYLIGFTFFRLSTEPLLYLQRGFWLVVGIMLIVAFFTDLFYGIIPDGVVITLTGLGILYRSLLFWYHIMQPVDFWYTMIAAVCATGFFYFLRWITKERGMGLGDVKFVFPLVLILGWRESIVGLFLAFVIGAVVSVALVAIKKKQFTNTVPFGPFLVTGTLVALVFGDTIVQWYLSLLR